MTTIVKKRLQAVVALLVCFMVLFAAFPSVPFNTEVKAANLRLYFHGDTRSTYNWSAGDVWIYDSSSSWYKMTKCSSFENNLYYYDFSSAPSWVIFVDDRGDWNGGDGKQTVDINNPTLCNNVTTGNFTVTAYHLTDWDSSGKVKAGTNNYSFNVAPAYTTKKIYFDTANNNKFHDETVNNAVAHTTWLKTSTMYIEIYSSSSDVEGTSDTAGASVNPGSIQQMTDEGNGIWSYTLRSDQTSYIRFLDTLYDGTAQTSALAGGGHRYANYSTRVNWDSINDGDTYIVKGTYKDNANESGLPSGSKGMRAVQKKSNSSNRSILQGVKYYNYFYDEQIVYEMLGGDKDPSDLKVKTAQYKNPYSLFNQAIMRSNYWDATSHPMYLGEFWLGGNGENGNTVATDDNYTSTPTNVKSGKRDRTDSIDNGGSVTYTFGNGTEYYAYDSNHIYKKYSDDNSAYGSQEVDVADLTKFVWGTNLAFRGTNSAQEHYHIIGTGLVDDTISTSISSDLYLTPTKNSKPLPYFDEDFLSGDETAYMKNKNLNNLTGGKAVGKVYNSIFPFYTRNVTFTNNGTSLSGTNPDSWIRTSSDENNHSWGSLLTVDGATKDLSGMYTFDSHIDSVRVNTSGGASENTNGGSSVTGQSSALGSGGLELTAEQIAALNTKYNSGADTWTASTLVGSADTSGTPYNMVKQGKDSNSSAIMSDAEMAILTAGGYFYDATGKVKDTDGQPGFFPFNKSGISTSELQYGFGVRLDIKFNVGTTGMKDSDPMIFRFSGDDDVWVFIDGKLVLDLGGAHKNAIGEINFWSEVAKTTYSGSSSAKSIWNKTELVGDTNKIKDVSGNINSQTNQTVAQILRACKDGQDHELTMFYMERGKLNSNMSIMFNFIAPEITPVEEIPETPEEIKNLPEPSGTPSSYETSDSVFKIVEETDFSSVNTGLQNLTKKAAENDVFNYTVQSNAKRSASTMRIGGFAFANGPTDIVRTPDYSLDSVTTGLTPTVQTADSGQTINVDSSTTASLNKVIYLDTTSHAADTALYVGVWTKNESDTEQVYVGRKVGEHLYAFPYWSGDAEFIYSSDRASGIKDGATTKPTEGVTTIRTENNPVDGTIYIGSSGSTTPQQRYLRRDYTSADTDWHGVAGINYVWKEAYAPDTGTSSLYLTNTTTDSGTFNLLYGLSDDESSATFTNQFYDKVNNEGQIRVNIAQRMVARPDNPSTPVNSWSGGTRNMGQYYNTKAKIVRKKADGTYDTSSVEWRNETVVAGVGGVVEIGGVAVDSTDMSVTITNMVTSGSVTVSKGIQWFGGTSSNNDEFYFKVTISNVFGLANNNPSLSEYAKITYDVSNTIDGTFSSYQNLRTGVPDNGALATAIGNCGLIKIKAGQTAKIEGLPEGTDVVIEELHLSQQKTSEAEWNAIYNKRSTGNAPTITATGLSNSIVNNEIGMKMSGTTYERLSRILEVSFTNGQDYFNTTAIKLVLRKTWDGHPSGETKPTITYLLERTKVDPATATDDDWSIVTSTGHIDGKYTIPSNTDSLEVQGEGIVDKADNDTFYYYRIREYGDGGNSLILKSGGWYNQNYQAIYDDSGKNTNIGIANANSNTTTYQKLESGTPSTLTLSVKNKYYATGESTGQPLPKTGARGVYAIVTFGAFAITIAGVALLIYRKKLQTVNIYAVKGSEKPKE